MFNSKVDTYGLSCQAIEVRGRTYSHTGSMDSGEHPHPDQVQVSSALLCLSVSLARPQSLALPSSL